MDVTENQDFGEMPAMQIGRSPEEEDTIDLVELFYTCLLYTSDAADEL